jgi:hypothetical protein
MQAASDRIAEMKAIAAIRVAAWTALMMGAALVVWQAASGHGSDLLFNIGVVAMIGGSVLRVYGNYKRGNRRAEGSRKPPDTPVST